jgi:hypothetical protein
MQRISAIDNQLARDESYREACQAFIDNGYSFVQNMSYPDVHENWQKPPLLLLPSPLAFFDLVVPNEVFELLAGIVNRNREYKLVNNRVAASYSRYYHRPATSDEMKQFYGMILLAENLITRVTRSLQKVLSKAQKERERENLPKMMGFQRFEMLMRCLVPTNDELFQIFSVMRLAYRRCWVGEGCVVLDETLYEYQPDAATQREFEMRLDPIPVVYIPRKPHPNGLLNYQLVAISSRSGQPYVLDFEPRITLDVSPRSALFSLMSRWESRAQTLHLVADSAFSGILTVTQLAGMGFRVTCSMSTREQKLTWQLLEKGLPSNAWRACQTPNGIMMSVHRSNQSDEGVHHLIDSSFFHGDPVSNTSPALTSPIPQSTAVTPQQQNIPCANSQSSGIPLPTTSCPPLPPPPSFEHVILPTFTLPVLLRMKLKDLRRLAKENNVRSGGKKEVVANRILSLCSPSGAQLGMQHNVLRDADAAIHHSDPPHHNRYREHFSGVDRHNRLWYRFRFSYRCCNWRTKILLSVLGSAVVNAWVLEREDAQTELDVFRATLSEQLLN